MSISTATDDRTEGDDDTSQGSHPKEDSSDSENEQENEAENHNDNENDGDSEINEIENEMDHENVNEMENENVPQNQNGVSMSPEVHEITSDEDECVVTNEDDSSNSSSESNDSSEGSQQSNKERDKHKNEESMENGEESDVEEVSIEDPLNQGKSKPVANDTKILTEQSTKEAKTQDGEQNKEPSVVIIDTNSILSGKGPTPVQNKNNTSLDAQNLCQSIAARGTTITPISCKASNNNSKNNQTNTVVPQANILPSLTDDMFVVEAPSFIVPYVYEKPSMKPFREFVDKLGKELEEIKLKEEQEKLEKEKAEKEKRDQERKERIARGEEVKEEPAEPEKENETDKETKKSEESAKDKKSMKKRKRRNEDDDDSWDGESSCESEEDGLSDDDTVVIKDKDDSIEEIKDPIGVIAKGIGGKADSYFECSLGQFFINIGLNLVQEYVQSDLLKVQNRKLYKEKKSGRSTKATESAITSLTQNLAFSKKLNAPYALEQKRCEFCSFKTESMLVMAHHLEAPHMKNNIYKCNICAFEIRSPHDILFHMEAEHNTRGRLERAPAYQQCPSCHFEDNSKTKLARHLIACAKKFKPEFNLGPPIEWEPPAKIPKLTRARNNAVAPYQTNFNRSQVGMSPLGRPPLNISNPSIPNMPMMGRPRGRPPMTTNPARAPVSGVPIIRSGVMIMHNNPPSGTTISNYPIMQNNQNATPKISITPLPRAPQPSSSNSAQNSKATFVICEICDGYIKDLEQLRNHMQWIHKVKIHPKMIYNRPPLNCQKCQFRFFTDQGLERHLLGSHGLVTSSMQEAANKGKDAGRCPVCGRVYQWKLLNHVSRDHNMTLKPAHLSYKCTVCTATFGMYKQFENHVYSAHSVVAKRVIDKNKSAAPSKSSDTEAMLKPLKISDEITIIPQPAKSSVTITAKGK
ncbi:MOG interacting and ectopic P-granules protein 1-like [Aricia agestis]|uniref:MOG interacting and ectopic P-granules protein 1-like n=1 Tax=Aricia agestis TaxID=91739 RepID=UPI001C202D7B|nr:MOG interacting and ectopic P-granules protein 1-like [Aricia agestis]